MEHNYTYVQYTWSGLTNVGRTRTPGLAGFLAFTRTKLFWGYNRTCLKLVAITK